MKFVFYFTFIFYHSLVTQAQKSMDNNNLPCQIIYKIDVNVKSKRPDRNTTPPLWKYALLTICKPFDEKITPQRQVIGVEWKGKTYWKELIEVNKVFETEEDAFSYSKTNTIPIASFKDNPNKVDYLSDNTSMPSQTKQAYIGIAKNAKAGACLIDDQNVMYLIDNLSEWTDNLLNKRLVVSGLLRVEEQIEPLQNDKGEYSAGTEGRSNIITNPELPKIRVTSSLIVVFKKETEESIAEKIMEASDYPFWKGMDSSKGKIYFYKTGNKYHILFPSELEKDSFKKKFEVKSEIYEIYQPNWESQKD